MNKLNTPFNQYCSSLAKHTQQKMTSNKQYIPSIWIVTKFFFLAILFQFPPCTICLNTQISNTVMTTAFESLQSIVDTIVTSAKIMNHAFLYFMETVGIASLQSDILSSKPLTQHLCLIITYVIYFISSPILRELP